MDPVLEEFSDILRHVNIRFLGLTVLIIFKKEYKGRKKERIGKIIKNKPPKNNCHLQ